MSTSAPRSPVDDRAPLRPTRTEAAAERGQLDRFVVPGQAHDVEVGRADDPDAVAIGEAGIVGVVGGDVLQVPGDGLEAQPGRRVHVAEVDPPVRPEHPPAGRDIDELDGHRPMVARHPTGFRIKPAPGCAETKGIGATMAPEDKGHEVSGLLERLGRRAVRHRWWFISVWVVMAVAVVALAGALDGQFSDNFRIPNTQSQQALDLLERDFPSRAGDNALVVFQSDAGITSSSVEPAISESVAALEKIPNVTTVTDPYGPFGSAFISKNGQIAVVTVQFDTQAQNLPKDVFDQIQQATAPATQAGVKLAYGGAVVDYADQPPQGNADLIGLLAAVVILLFAFGSVVAMGLPILTALLGLGIGISIVHVVASMTDIGSVAPVLATMIGLGVGIDYSLFIVTRYRENRATGMELEAAVGRSVATAGSAVLFAGTTVVIAICGLAIAGIPYVARLGYMAGIVVAVMMLAALTLLPVDHRGGRQRHRPLEGPEPHPPSRPRRGRGRGPDVARGQRLGAVGDAGRPARVAVRHRRRGDPAGDRVAGAVDAPR